TQFMETVSKATENVVRVAGNETGADAVAAYAEALAGGDAEKAEADRAGRNGASGEDQGSRQAARRKLTRAAAPYTPDLDLTRLLDLGASMLKDLARA